MRIILATGPAGDIGGPSKYAAALAEHLGKFDITSRRVSYTKFEQTFSSGIRHVIYFVRVFFALWNSDAVLAFDTWSVGMPALLAAWILRKPSLFRIGGDFLWEEYVSRTGDLIPLSKFYETRRKNFSFKEKCIYRGTRFLLKHASVLAFNSHWHVELWRKAYGVPLSQASVIENVYPQRKTYIPYTAKTFVAAGRNTALKQTALLEEIFAELRKEYPDIHLDTKALPPAEHEARIAGCYAVILASVSDVAPNAIIDSVVYGKPFICTSDTGITERLQGTGIFVDTTNKDAIKKSIVSLLDASMYTEVSERVQAFTFIHTWEEIVSEFATAIQTCVS